MRKKKVSLCLIALTFCFTLFKAEVDSSDNRHIDSESGSSIHRQIQYSFTLQNKTNRLLNKAEFWTYAPVKLTSTQRCIKLEASYPYELIEDDLGNQILYFRFGNISPYDTKFITIKASLLLFDKPSSISVQDINPFIQPEKYIESDHPELLKFAGKFKDQKQIKTAENIFRWVANNVHYAGYLRDGRGALYTLRDCTEYMYLFVALCRASDIPARGIGGYVYSGVPILNPSSYHNWAEFYDDSAWRIADPQKKVFMHDSSHYIAMNIISDSPKNPMGEFYRFRFAGDGLEVKMNGTK